MVLSDKNAAKGTAIVVGGFILYVVTTVCISETFVATGAGDTESPVDGDKVAASGMDGTAETNLLDVDRMEHIN